MKDGDDERSGAASRSVSTGGSDHGLETVVGGMGEEDCSRQVRRQVKFVKQVGGTMKTGRELIEKLIEKLYEAYVRRYGDSGI